MEPERTWHRVAQLDALEADRPHGVVIERAHGEPIRLVLIRREGRVHAFRDRCPHRGASFADVGFCDEGQLICGWHFWAFDLVSGEHSHIDSIRLKRFETRTVDGAVEVAVSE